jgi:plasmid stabilization system protein ParE
MAPTSTRRKKPAWANTSWTRFSPTLTRYSCTPGSTLHFGYHRLLSKRFPYVVYYRVEGNVAQVWAVLDCRQDPEKIVRRLMQGRS